MKTAGQKGPHGAVQHPYRKTEIEIQESSEECSWVAGFHDFAKICHERGPLQPQEDGSVVTNTHRIRGNGTVIAKPSTRLKIVDSVVQRADHGIFIRQPVRQRPAFMRAVGLGGEYGTGAGVKHRNPHTVDIEVPAFARRNLGNDAYRTLRWHVRQ
jgi:hypothetical protein